MFGLGFGEMVVLGIVLLVVVGPRELPKLLKSVGRGINKLRRMSADLREQSGIDDILDEEGLREDLQSIRSLSRGRVVDGFVGGVMANPGKRKAKRPRMAVKALEDLAPPDGDAPPREDEWPAVGEDAAGALPDDATEDELAAARAAKAEAEAEAKADAEASKPVDEDGPTSGEREVAKAEGAP